MTVKELIKRLKAVEEKVYDALSVEFHTHINDSDVGWEVNEVRLEYGAVVLRSLRKDR